MKDNGKIHRKILFRGKRLDNGEWVYGYYVHFNDYLRDREIHLIYTGDADSMPKTVGKGYDFIGEHYEVDPKTVGQFVCLDCKGNNLFEDDIVKTRVTNGRFKKNPRFENLVVSYNEKYGKWENGCFGTFYPERMEVVGNIHDNPQLANLKFKIGDIVVSKCDGQWKIEDIKSDRYLVRDTISWITGHILFSQQDNWEIK